MTNQTKFNLSKKDIAKNLSKKTGLSVKFIEGYIDKLFDEILVELASKKKLKIKNFGSFSVKFKKSRVGRESIDPPPAMVFKKPAKQPTETRIVKDPRSETPG